MPEMHFTLRWPDGTESIAYSPSLVVREHLVAGATYPVAEFVARSTEALGIGSERVRARFGMPCSRALSQIDVIRRTAGRFQPHEPMTVLAFEDL